MQSKRDAELSAVRRRTLISTNLIICLVLLLGFALTTHLTYRFHYNTLTHESERTATLVSDMLAQRLNATIAQPTDVCFTIASDSLLHRYLEQPAGDSTAHATGLQDYLYGYHLKFGFPHLFLVPATTERLHQFSGVSRPLSADNPEDDWYYNLLSGGAEHAIGTIRQGEGEMTLSTFIICKIRSDSGTVLGVVGIGVPLDPLDELITEYRSAYNARIYLLDRDGTVQAATVPNPPPNLPEHPDFIPYTHQLLPSSVESQHFWFREEGSDAAAVSRYIPFLEWRLVVTHSTGHMGGNLTAQLRFSLVCSALLLALTLIILSTVLYRHSRRMVSLSSSQELEYQRMLQAATEGLYENIFEWDISHNSIRSESTRQYLRQLGGAEDIRYEDAIHLIASRQIKPEHVPGYLDMYQRDHVLAAFHSGINNLSYDFLQQDSDGYHWTRINARIFFWHSDQSVHMITYRQRIDAEKNRELSLIQQSRQDSLSGLLNKRSAEEEIFTILQLDGRRAKHALLLLDIDDFKRVNDNYGHAFGDQVITAFSTELKSYFRESDVVGRVGGDEFVVLIRSYSSVPAVRARLERFCTRISHLRLEAQPDYRLHVSLGVSLSVLHGSSYDDLYEKADQALYFSKNHGKSTFTIYSDSGEERISFMVNPRDMDALINVATDGISKVACKDDEFRLLYFNAARVALTGTTAETLSDPALDVLAQIHPDDLPGALEILHAAMPARNCFSVVVRLRHQDGHWFPVRIRGLFVSELYEGIYPIFYAVYTDLSR